MFLINHLYTVDETVYYVDNNSVKIGVVVKVTITVTASGTTISYLLRVGSGTVTKQEKDLYGNCKAEGGYQNATFTSGLSTSTVLIPKGSLPIGSVLRASVVVDGGPSKAFTLTITAGAGSPSVSTVVTVQDILNNLNSVLTPVADAHIVQNNIRITSRSTGATSTVVITDGDAVGSPTGSPLELPYFETLALFTGLGSSVEGKADGALEVLGQQIC